VNPKFSIILPAYNREKTIQPAIDSILNQTFTNFEIIVIDDASTDQTAAIVKQNSDKRIHLIQNKTNLERCVSRNIGIEQALGTYICFLDSDDYHLPNHLEILNEQICKDNHPICFYFTNAWNQNFEGERSERVCPTFTSFDPYYYFLTFTVNPQRWCVHAAIFKHVQFDPNVIICEDMDTSLRITQAGFTIKQIEERTTIYVAYEESFTYGDPRKAEKEFKNIYKIFKKPELKKLLPRKAKNKLLSMCYYNFVLSHEKFNFFKVLTYALLAFLYYPKGYNHNANKTMFVITLYRIPLLGAFVKELITKMKGK
jgi:glycosyltransferase involved in cell wall biosynthesis